MKKYLVLYHAPASMGKKMEGARAEDKQKGMQAWMQWAQKCGSGLLDMGTPLGGGMKVTPAGSAPSDKNVVWLFHSAGRRHGRCAGSSQGPSALAVGRGL